jgi:hypothetical protein
MPRGILLGSPKNINLKIIYMTKAKFSNACSLQTFLQKIPFSMFFFLIFWPIQVVGHI